MLFENFQRNLFIGHKTNFVKQLKLSTKVKLLVLFYVITEFNENKLKPEILATFGAGMHQLVGKTGNIIFKIRVFQTVPDFIV